MRRTAASVNCWNDDSDDDPLVMTGGGGRPEVADRMLSIFFVKKSAKPWAMSCITGHDDDQAPMTWNAMCTEQPKNGRKWWPVGSTALSCYVDSKLATRRFYPKTTVIRTACASVATFQTMTFTAMCATVGIKSRPRCRTPRATTNDLRWR